MFGTAGWTSPRGGNAPDVPNGPLDALARWAAEQPDRAVYTFVGDKGEQLAQLTYSQLERATDALARHLRFAAKLKAGDRVLLVYPPGLDFIVAFLACLRAGLIAVPAFPPEPTRLSKDLALFAGTAANCGAKVALTNSLYSHAKKLAGLAQLLRLSGGGRWPELRRQKAPVAGRAPKGAQRVEQRVAIRAGRGAVARLVAREAHVRGARGRHVRRVAAHEARAAARLVRAGHGEVAALLAAVAGEARARRSRSRSAATRLCPAAAGRDTARGRPSFGQRGPLRSHLPAPHRGAVRGPRRWHPLPQGALMTTDLPRVCHGLPMDSR
jgi:hypothetical protein